MTGRERPGRERPKPDSHVIAAPLVRQLEGNWQSLRHYGPAARVIDSTPCPPDAKRADPAKCLGNRADIRGPPGPLPVRTMGRRSRPATSLAMKCDVRGPEPWIWLRHPATFTLVVLSRQRCSRGTRQPRIRLELRFGLGPLLGRQPEVEAPVGDELTMSAIGLSGPRSPGHVCGRACALRTRLPTDGPFIAGRCRRSLLRAAPFDLASGPREGSAPRRRPASPSAHGAGVLDAATRARRERPFGALRMKTRMAAERSCGSHWMFVATTERQRRSDSLRRRRECAPRTEQTKPLDGRRMGSRGWDWNEGS